MSITVNKTKDPGIFFFDIKNEDGTYVRATNYGAILMDIVVPDSRGENGDVILGYDSPIDYTFGNPGSLGAVCGRYANRIRAGYSIGGKYYPLVLNNGANQLHGGPEGFSKKRWSYDIDGYKLMLTCTSADGEMGHPGNVTATVTYSFSQDHRLEIDYRATSDADTYVNLTNHAYFNLKGSGEIMNHRLLVNAEKFTVTDDFSCPTGEIKDVAGTPLDFRTPKPIWRDFYADFHQIRLCGGYDNNFCIDGSGFRHAATLFDDESGRKLEVFTDLPGIQVYCGQFLHELKGKNGASYGPLSGVALETQFYPDTPNLPGFPSCLLKSGGEYHHKTVYAFSLI